MRGKSGFLKILEAFLAIMLIAGVLTFIYISQVRQPQQEDYVYQLLRLSLKEISNNPDLRENVLNLDYGEYDSSTNDGNAQNIANVTEEILPSDYEFKFKICKLDSACGLQNLPDKEVFSQEVSVSSTLEEFDEPKKIRIFVWKK